MFTTAGIVGMYNLAFKNRWYFYNFFNKPGWRGYGIGRKFKKFTLLYLTYVANVQMFSYTYDKTLLHDIKKEGLFDKYNLEYFFNENIE
jgi:hypothetical protein